VDSAAGFSPADQVLAKRSIKLGRRSPTLLVGKSCVPPDAPEGVRRKVPGCAHPPCFPGLKNRSMDWKSYRIVHPDELTGPIVPKTLRDRSSRCTYGIVSPACSEHVPRSLLDDPACCAGPRYVSSGILLLDVISRGQLPGRRRWRYHLRNGSTMTRISLASQSCLSLKSSP
jgi:hypothetical protein